MSAPEVTIGLPVYNAERYLREAVESIKAQTFTDFRVLAVLDAPTDRSGEILRELADERFDILNNETNLGLCRTCNVLLERTESPLLARMDADDVMHPERIARQLHFLREHPETDVLGTYFDSIDGRGRVVKGPTAFPVTHEEIRAGFRIGGVMHHPTVMFRTQRIRDVGGYEFKYAEDFALWLKCLTRGYRFANLPEVLLHYRVHRRQIMSELREPTLAGIDRAYAMFGPAIWGKDAPDYVAGKTRLQRLWRRVKRKMGTGESLTSP